MAPYERSRCAHAWDQGLESLAFGRARSAADIFGFIHPVVHVGRSGQDRSEALVRSCCSLRSEPEFSAVDPHAMQDDGDLASNGDDGASPTFGLHQHMPQAFRPDHLIERMSMALAAA